MKRHDRVKHYFERESATSAFPVQLDGLTSNMMNAMIKKVCTRKREDDRDIYVWVVWFYDIFSYLIRNLIF